LEGLSPINTAERVLSMNRKIDQTIRSVL